MVNHRLDFSKASPGGYAAMRALQAHVDGSGLEHRLLELVKMRASQINGCAFCIDMHSKDARAAGETEQRLYLLNAWRETSSIYTARERAALAWTEAVTRLGEDAVSDGLYDQMRVQFSDRELADLTLAIVTINSWNRLAISFRSGPAPTESDR